MAVSKLCRSWFLICIGHLLNLVCGEFYRTNLSDKTVASGCFRKFFLQFPARAAGLTGGARDFAARRTGRARP
jgi:hypothetical protein